MGQVLLVGLLLGGQCSDWRNGRRGSGCWLLLYRSYTRNEYFTLVKVYTNIL